MGSRFDIAGRRAPHRPRAGHDGRSPGSRTAMDWDELLILLLSAAAATAYWGWWYVRFVRLETLAPAGRVRLLLRLTQLFCLVLVLVVLTTSAAAEVRRDPAYVALFVATWAVALGAVDTLG